METARVPWLCAVTLLLMAAVMGCGASARPHAAPAKSHTLVFDFTGRGELSSLAYVINGKATAIGQVMLPWRKTLHLPAKAGGYTWKLTGRLKSGSEQDVVYVDGKALVSGSCQGSGCSIRDSGSVGG
ncbi:MAG: hypothetical protein J2P25_12790 [Nocardiopsaceae bacterium]|nr:hypothetical protein [Nocardiopsaceae bacterium]